MWAILTTLVYVVAFRASDNSELMGAIAASIPVIMNYAYRRFTQVQTGSGTYGDKDETH